MKNLKPNNRKPRNNDYATTTKLIKEHGLEKIHAVWREKGMYRTAEEFTSADLPVTP